MGRFVEVSTNGFDESLIGLSSSPFGGGNPTFVGLRIPSLVPAGAPGVSGRYLFLLATRLVSAPTRVVGIDQLLSIATSLPTTPPEGTVPELPLEFDVSSPEFKFSDGNVSWHLVVEPAQPVAQTFVATDVPSFKFGYSNAGPALLYNTFGASSLNPSGGPINYPINLTAYTPPQIWDAWRPLAEGLFVWNDMRFSWKNPHDGNVDIPISVAGGPQRVSMYASVLQTTADENGIPVLPSPLPQGLLIMPEWQFIESMFNLSPSAAVNYWRIGGRLQFIDEEC